MLTICDQDDFHSMTDDYSIADSVIKQLISSPSTELVSNVKTKIAVMISKNQVWPITINEKEYQNALICSPYTTYVRYPLDELKKFKKLWIKSLVLLNSAIMSILCRITQFNRAVQVNNNLNSLIKHPKEFITLIPVITQEMIKRYSNHAINFFRVNDILDGELLAVLKENGYLVFPDRVAHVFFPTNSVMQRSHTKRDISLLRKSNYKIVSHDELTEQDAKRLSELYSELFINKHSKCNPIYTELYFKKALRYRWHHYTALRNQEGCIDAFVSWFESENTMICGPLGYASSVDSKVGLYRQLVALCLQHANTHQLPFNMGGGSDEFKSRRGSTETLEYTAVYCKHLTWYRHIPWKILHWACNKMLKKIVKNSDL